MKHEDKYDLELGLMILVLLFTTFVAGLVIGHMYPEIEPCNYGIARQ